LEHSQHLSRSPASPASASMPFDPLCRQPHAGLGGTDVAPAGRRPSQPHLPPHFFGELSPVLQPLAAELRTRGGSPCMATARRLGESRFRSDLSASAVPGCTCRSPLIGPPRSGRPAPLTRGSDFTGIP